MKTLYILKQELQQLENKLDSPLLNDFEFHTLNEKANFIQDQINTINNQAKQQAFQATQDKVDNITFLIKEGRTQELIDLYGNEFINDYSISSSFQVLSSCFNPRNPNGTNCWQFNSHKEAQAKVIQLVYWRIYNYYIRNEKAA